MNTWNPYEEHVFKCVDALYEKRKPSFLDPAYKEIRDWLNENPLTAVVAMGIQDGNVWQGPQHTASWYATTTSDSTDYESWTTSPWE